MNTQTVAAPTAPALTLANCKKLSSSVVWIYVYHGGRGDLLLPCRCNQCDSTECVHTKSAWMLYWWRNDTPRKYPDVAQKFNAFGSEILAWLVSQKGKID